MPTRKRLTEIARQCTAESLRRATRAVNRVYADALKDSDLSGNQFSLLVAIVLSEPVAIGGLADRTHIDRTTLTRNLKLLRDAGLIGIQSGSDRRRQLVVILPLGKHKLDAAVPQWRAAQSHLSRRFGPERLARLRDDLNALQEVIAR